MLCIFQAIQNRWIRSCHDLSEGGLAVALSEMCLGGGWGAEITFTLPLPAASHTARELSFLFSESAGRWLIEVEPQNISRLRRLFSSLPFAVIGKVKKNSYLTVFSFRKKILSISVSELENLWNSFSHPQVKIW